MPLNDTNGTLYVPARDLPVPQHLSEQAQALMRLPVPKTFPPYPDLSDTEGWRQRIAATDTVIMEMIAAAVADAPVRIREWREGAATAFRVTPDDVAATDRRICLDVHGGGLIQGGGPVCRASATLTALQFNAPVVSVDYRMPPDHPFPTGVDDCVTFYRALLRDYRPEEIIVTGASAGGNVAAAMILKARDQGLPLPAAAVLITPEVDLTESGDSFKTNMGVDRTLRGSLMQANLLYAGGHDLTHPYVSPLFGDFTRGFPPTLLTAGTRDLFLSNAVRMHRALRSADVHAELHIVEAMSHGTFGGTPEDMALTHEIRLFCAAHWPRR